MAGPLGGTRNSVHCFYVPHRHAPSVFPSSFPLTLPGGNAPPRGISTDPRSLGEPVWGDGDTLGRPGRCFCEPDKDTSSFGMVEQLLGHPSAISTQVDGEKGKQLALSHFFRKYIFY